MKQTKTSNSHSSRVNYLERPLKENSNVTGIASWVKSYIATRKRMMKGTRICTV